MRPGYKQTEVGVIPEDWEAKPLRWAISDLRAGVSVNSETHEGTSSDQPAVLKTSALFEGRVDPRERKPIIARDLERAHLSLRAGSVLISRMNTPELVGECGFIEADKPNLFLPDRIWMTEFDPSAGVSGRWLASVLSSRAMRNRLKGIATGTSGSMKNIAKDAMLSLVLPFPSPSEQRAIAAALGDVDAAVAGLERLITKKRDLKQAAMQQLLTGQTRLPGFSGAWEVKCLSDLCDMKSGDGITSKRLTQSGSFPCYGGNGLRGYTNQYTHDGNFVVIGRVGALCGNVIVVSGQFFASEHAIVVTVRQDVSVEWLGRILADFNLNRFSESSAQPVLTVSKLLTLEVTIPPSEAEQTAIATVLSDIDAELAALQAQLDKTRLIKQAMMQDLLTGRVRLPFQ